MVEQTAVEWLEIELKKIPFINPKEAFERAKQMEKEQINNACYDGYYQEEWYDVRKYYDSKYGNKVASSE